MKNFQGTGDKVKSSMEKKEEGKEGKKSKNKEKDAEEDSFEKIQPVNRECARKQDVSGKEVTVFDER